MGVKKNATWAAVVLGVFTLTAWRAGIKSVTAVTEDKALLGSNLSAVDGPELGGGVTALPPLPCPWAVYGKRGR